MNYILVYNFSELPLLKMHISSMRGTDSFEDLVVITLNMEIKGEGFYI